MLGKVWFWEGITLDGKELTLTFAPYAGAARSDGSPTARIGEPLEASTTNSWPRSEAPALALAVGAMAAADAVADTLGLRERLPLANADELAAMLALVRP